MDPEHKFVHFSSVMAASVPDWLNVSNDVLEEKQPRYTNPPIVAGLCVGTMLSVGEGAEDEADVRVMARPGWLELEAETAVTETVVLVVAALALAEDAAALSNTADGPRKVPLIGTLMVVATGVGSTAGSTAVLYTSM